MPVGDKLSSSIPRVMTVTILVPTMRCFKKHPNPHWAILVKIMSVGHPAIPDTTYTTAQRELVQLGLWMALTHTENKDLWELRVSGASAMFPGISACLNAPQGWKDG